MLNEIRDKAALIRGKVLNSCDFASMTDADLELEIERCIENEFEDSYLSVTERADIADQVFSLIRGFRLLD